MRRSQASRALEAIVRDLIDTPDGATYFAERVWGINLRYDLGGGHPLVGRSSPDFELGEGRKLGDLLLAGKGLLLDFAEGAPLREQARAFAPQVTHVASSLRKPLGLDAVLVRPDGIVAWVDDALAADQPFAQAASRWFGKA